MTEAVDGQDLLEKVADGTPDEVRNNEDVITAYLGTSH